MGSSLEYVDQRRHVLRARDGSIGAMPSDAPAIGLENDLRRRIEALERDLGEAQRREAATADVLRAIRQSPSQLQPVVDAIVQTAKRLCAAERVSLWRWREEKFDLLAHTIVDPVLAKYLKD